ncbi:MAG: hypothetical protein QOH71_1481 [Blastocatellia bacterium]|jgi:hypothetical protein|nr:hypothetical protein [Blastocatellia bacterium]
MLHLTRRALNKLVLSGFAGSVFSLKRSVLAQTQPNRAASDYKNCFDRARALRKEYLLESVTLLISMSETKSVANSTERRAKARTVYTMRALQNITKQKAAFTESYSSKYAKIQRWKGTSQEVYREERPDYDVLFGPLKDGEIKTIVTGADYVYSLPLPIGRSALRGSVPLSASQDHWSYPNDNDIVCEINIVLESDSIRVQPVSLGAKRRGIDGRITAHNVIAEAPPEAQSNISLTASWSNVMPGEIVSLFFTW